MKRECASEEDSWDEGSMVRVRQEALEKDEMQHDPCCEESARKDDIGAQAWVERA